MWKDAIHNQRDVQKLVNQKIVKLSPKFRSIDWVRAKCWSHLVSGFGLLLTVFFWWRLMQVLFIFIYSLYLFTLILCNFAIYLYIYLFVCSYAPDDTEFVELKILIVFRLRPGLSLVFWRLSTICCERNVVHNCLYNDGERPFRYTV